MHLPARDFPSMEALLAGVHGLLRRRLRPQPAPPRPRPAPPAPPTRTAAPSRRGDMAEPHLCDCVGRRREVSSDHRESQEEDARAPLRFQVISEALGSETSHAIDGIREPAQEFGPNSGPKFHASPNARIRVRILQFPIPDPILCLQTRCKEHNILVRSFSFKIDLLSLAWFAVSTSRLEPFDRIYV
jgi:hypothetical protein